MSPRKVTTLHVAALSLAGAALFIHATAAAPGLGVGGASAATNAVPAPLSQDAGSTQAWAAKVAPDVVAQTAQPGAAEVDVLVAFQEPAALRRQALRPGAAARMQWIADTGDALARDFAPQGVQVLRRFAYLGTVYARVPVAALPALAADARVEGIAANHKVHALDADGRSLMRVNQIQPPWNGAGVGIAFLDSGVDYTHPDLAPAGTKTIKLYDEYHQATDPNYAKDDNGHGTEVAGIAAGTGAGNAGAIGVAPAATIVAVKVLDSTGSANDTQILAGINAVLASVSGGNPYNIRAANFSLGGYETQNGSGAAAVPQQPCDAEGLPLVNAFQQLISAGVVPVVAAGNGGCTNGVSWPACISTSLAVGAVYDASVTGGISYSDAQQCNGANGCSDAVSGTGQVACFSDSGAKLDVWAPTCALAPTMGGGYDTLFCGTSASAAFGSGMVALLSQADPAASAATIRDALKTSGMPITDSRNGITRNLMLADQAVGQLQCATPAVPAGLASTIASVCSGEQFVVSWGGVSGAASYTIQMATDPSFATATSSITTTTSANFSSTGSTAGTLYFRVRANPSCGTSSAYSSAIQVSYTPLCSITYTHTYFVSGVARTPGYAPAFWYSDLTVLNAGAAPAQIRVSFYGASAYRVGGALALGAHQQITWTDALNTLFGIGQDKGMITVESTQPLRTYSRTYSQVTSGTTVSTFGQAYVGMEASEALTSTGVGYLGALRSDAQYRTNLEFANVTNTATDVQVTFFDNAGTQIGAPLTVTVPGLRWVQKTLALPAGQSSAFAEVHVLAAGAGVISFATVVDGTSTDPTGIAMWVP
jgi:subtilisin family serine protease